VRDRLLVTSTIGAEQSTALISAAGQRFDFNAADASGSRLTPEEFSRLRGQSRPQMNNIDLYIPTYITSTAYPGQVVAWLRDSAGTVQAAFVYKGLVTYNSREALLLDLAIVHDGRTPDRTIGFSIVDRSRALPMLFAATGRPSIRVEQVECRD
jgi:hypothetical protein